jgi:hypothetical protein
MARIYGAEFENREGYSVGGDLCSSCFWEHEFDESNQGWRRVGRYAESCNAEWPGETILCDICGEEIEDD